MMHNNSFRSVCDRYHWPVQCRGMNSHSWKYPFFPSFFRNEVSHTKTSCLVHRMKEPWGILDWDFLQVVARNIAKIVYDPRFTKIHCSPKELQLPNSLDGLSFVILMIWLVVRLSSISWELLNIFWRGFSQALPRGITNFEITQGYRPWPHVTRKSVMKKR